MKRIILCAVCWLALFGSANAIPIVNGSTTGQTAEDSLTIPLLILDSLGQPTQKLDTTWLMAIGPGGDSVIAEKINGVAAGTAYSIVMHRWNAGLRDSSFYAKAQVSNLIGATPRSGVYTVYIVTVSSGSGGWLRTPQTYQFQYVGKELNDVLFAVQDTVLRPTDPGRTLDVSTTGEAGVDWANVGSPTTTVGLSGTTISTTQAIASVSGAVGSVTGAVGSVTGAVGSVTGAVGSVTGAVGSVGTGGITALSIADGAIDSNTFTVDSKAMIAKHADSVANQAIKTKTDFLPSATAGATGGVFIAGTNAATTITTALTTTFTGNLTGSVGSVTGSVGSVTGSVGSVTAAVPVNFSAITGTLDAAEIGTDAITATKIAAASITVSEAPNLDAAVSTRSTYVAATDSVITDGSALLALKLDDGVSGTDSTLLPWLRAGAAAGAGGGSTVAQIWGEVQAAYVTAGTFGYNLNAQISGVSGGAGIGAYTYSITLKDTSAIPDVVIGGVQVRINNLTQTGQVYYVATNTSGIASFNLNAGQWVVFTTDPRFVPNIDTITVAAAGGYTLNEAAAVLVDTDANTTTVAFYINKPDGTANDSAQVNIELRSINPDSLLRVGNTVIAATYRQMFVRTDANGRALVDLYGNALFTNDSTYYRATIKNRYNDKLIDEFKFRVPTVTAPSDTVHYINNLPRWK